MPNRVDADQFRYVMGQYPSGVVVVTATSASGAPLGMTVGSFTSVSLEPQLVAFMPNLTSKTWAQLSASGGNYCINILGAHQEDVCRAMASRGVDKFADVDWRLSPGGSPLLDGSVAYIDCVAVETHESGDHLIVVCEVEGMEVENAALPLLFFGGGYGSFTPSSRASGDADLVDQLRLIDMTRQHMDDLASDLDTEVTAICKVGEELVLAAASGRAPGAVAPSRVGDRVPLMPPLGSLFVAWEGDEARKAWLAQAEAGGGAASGAAAARSLELIRERGYSFALSHQRGRKVAELSAQLSGGSSGAVEQELREAIWESRSSYNTESFRADATHELRSITAPVFHADSRVAFTLTLWGPVEPVTAAEIEMSAVKLLETAQRASDALRDGRAVGAGAEAQ